MPQINHNYLFSRPHDHPYGMVMPNRHGNAHYRYGYQGSERDDEVKGNGNSYTTEFRQLDPRLGRWLSLDPLAAKFPWQSPYCSMDNNPILLNDVKGDKTPKEEKTLKKEQKQLNKEFDRIAKNEKKWAKNLAKKLGGTVIKDTYIIDENDRTTSYSVRASTYEEGIGDVPSVIVNQEYGKKRYDLRKSHNKITNKLEGYYYNQGEVMGITMSFGYDMYVGGGISGSVDLVMMGGETAVGGTFGGGLGLGGGAGIDVGTIICNQSGRYRAGDIQEGEGWGFSAGIGPLSYSRSGDRTASAFYWNGETNTTSSIDFKSALEKSNWLSIYETIALKSLNSVKAKVSIKYEWNRSTVWGTF